MTPGKFLIPTVLLLLFGSVPALAAVPYASGDADRKAKQAVPPAGKALVYVYRAQDNGPALSPELRVNSRVLSGLAARTYLYWAVDPGQVNLRIGDSRPLSLRTQNGRIYFVRLAVQADGRSELRQVSYGSGRQDLHRARLVRETAPAKPAPPPVAARSGFNLIVKGGSFSLGSASQNIEATDLSGTPVTFRTSFSQTAPVFGLEGEWYGESGWAFGGEVTTHAHDYTTTGPIVGQGEMQVVTVTVNTRKYFRPGTVVQPFLGAGLGLATVNLSGQLKGSTTGFAVQAGGGLAFRWEHFGLFTELKYQLVETSEVSASGASFLAGWSVHF